ncbi:response regulator [bacterium]|nr:MAG: response regulator [bacterium]
MSLIMIVDDEKYVRESFGKLLSREGYEIKLAATGDEALDLLNTIKPNAILLDFKMPGLDGVEVCKRIRANDKTRAIPIIMITAYPHEKIEALQAGADDFLNKPTDPVDVSMRIKCVLKIGELTDELERTKAYLEELKKNHKDW